MSAVLCFLRKLEGRSCLPAFSSFYELPMGLHVCVRLAAQLYPTLQPQGLYPIRLLCPQDLLSKNTGVGSHSLLRGIFPTQGSNPGLLHCRRFLYLGRQRSPAFYISDALYPDSLVLCPPDLLSHAL